MISQGIVEGAAPVRIGCRGMSELIGHDRIGHQARHGSLQHVADPSGSETLSTFHPANGRFVSSEIGEPEVWRVGLGC